MGVDKVSASIFGGIKTVVMAPTELIYKLYKLSNKNRMKKTRLAFNLIKAYPKKTLRTAAEGIKYRGPNDQPPHGSPNME